MREIRQSGSEGGAKLTFVPTPIIAQALAWVDSPQRDSPVRAREWCVPINSKPFTNQLSRRRDNGIGNRREYILEGSCALSGRVIGLKPHPG